MTHSGQPQKFIVIKKFANYRSLLVLQIISGLIQNPKLMFIPGSQDEEPETAWYTLTSLLALEWSIFVSHITISASDQSWIDNQSQWQS